MEEEQIDLIGLKQGRSLGTHAVEDQIPLLAGFNIRAQICAPEGTPQSILGLVGSTRLLAPFQKY